MTEKNFLTKTLTDTVLSRRSFLKWSAVLGGSVVLTGAFTSCSNQALVDQNQTVLQATTGNEVSKMAICPNMGCHQNCPVVAHVRDGQLVRVSAPDFPGIPEFNHICVRGLASWKLPYLDKRLNYPLKRVGERGSGEWERISWEEAYDTIATRLGEIRDKYGSKGVLMKGSGSSSVPLGGVNAGASTTRFSNLFGCTEIVGWTIDGGPYVAALSQYGFFFAGGNDPRDWKNSKLIINWGKNTAEAAMRDMKFVLDAKDHGAKLIHISINYDPTAAKADEWIGIEPASDGALAMGMMNVILREGLHDQAYLIYSTVAPLLVDVGTGKFARGSDISPEMDKALYVVWDETSQAPAPMPPHVHALPNVTPALDGEYTIGGKTYATAFHLLAQEIEKYPPEEAARITGVPLETIERLAVEYATSKPAIINLGTGVTRYFYGDLEARAILTLGALTGNVGISGGGTSGWTGGFNPTLNTDPINAANEKRSMRIHCSEGYRTITEGIPHQVKGMLVFGNNPVHTLSNYQVWINEILPKLDFIVTIDIVESETAHFSDIILPATSIYERKDLMTNLGYAVLCQQPIKPLFERKSDLEICTELANRLGFGEYFKYTEEDFFRVMLDSPSLEGVTLERLNSEGGLVFGNGPMEPQIGFLNQDYWTPSGRIEFYAEQLASVGEALPGHKGAGEVVDSDLGKRYPVRFLTGRRRFWTQSMSFYPAVREINPKPTLQVNPKDAEARGIKNGDLVRVYNDRGEMVVSAMLQPGIRPGSVYIEHGWKPEEFVSGFYQNLLRPLNMPDKNMINPVWTTYWEAWKDYATNAPSPGLTPYGLADQLFDALCEFEKYKA